MDAGEGDIWVQQPSACSRFFYLHRKNLFSTYLISADFTFACIFFEIFNACCIKSKKMARVDAKFEILWSKQAAVVERHRNFSKNFVKSLRNNNSYNGAQFPHPRFRRILWLTFPSLRSTPPKKNIILPLTTDPNPVATDLPNKVRLTFLLHRF